MNVTVPSDDVNVDGDATVTVAVRTTGCPYTEELGEEESAVDVTAWETGSTSAADELGEKFGVPE